jgi:hypothetical protein
MFNRGTERRDAPVTEKEDTMGRESRVQKFPDQKMAVKVAATLGKINVELAHVQIAVISHQQDGQPIGAEARERLDFVVAALVKLQQLFEDVK